MAPSSRTQASRAQIHGLRGPSSFPRAPLPVSAGADLPAVAGPHAAQPSRSALARVAWSALGVVLVAVGAIGVFLPGLPTTPFLILAAACFARSSQRLYDRLLASSLFGPAIRDFREGKGIPYRARRWALGLMWTFVTFAVTLGIPQAWWPAKIPVVLAAVVGTVVLLRLPARR